MSQAGIARCPYCDRTIATDHSRYKRHSTSPGTKNTCPLSGQHTPVTGHSPSAYLSRAYLVSDLAEQVQDRDPALVWEYLTALPAAELQRLLVVALAGLRIDVSIDELFGWVTELPAATVTHLKEVHA
ncbi:DUF7368 family protein [Mycolicibacterium sp. XJ1819]